ncbi:MAG: RNA-guided endonuclease InsQ/TnpB family protein [Dehalococcoidia bacterium]
MLKTFRYRIFPTKKQTASLEAVLEECRYLYNRLLEQRKYAWEIQGASLGYYHQANMLPIIKKTRNFRLSHSQVLQNVAVRVDLAFKAFFRRAKAGVKPGFPRFKGKGWYDSITFPQVPSGCRLKDGRLAVSKVGHIKIIMHRKMCGKPKTATIRRSSTGKWYVTFACEIETQHLPVTNSAVGIDVGLHTFAMLSDGTPVENPRFFREEEKALAKAQRKMSKATKGTPERAKRHKVVARVHERITCRRDNFSHQESRKIVNNFGFIAVEDLAVNRMVHNHCLAKSIADAAWSGFFSMLSYKAESAGRKLVKVNPAYTTQDCHRCGHRQKLTLADRIYVCPCCGLHIDRDLNAAKNILRLGMQSLKPDSSGLLKPPA